ncbi:hypothetical protein JZ751_012148 [Albula glossodonta]|uniref:Uncharacterized protein n=1 Tax=Albula glossodonta TaxID=121402 RepID=A0A8T2PRQ1_9TELE|nr:hypothetical protein JZ751_012148 [Albula glossodonta]
MAMILAVKDDDELLQRGAPAMHSPNLQTPPSPFRHLSCPYPPYPPHAHPTTPMLRLSQDPARCQTNTHPVPVPSVTLSNCSVANFTHSSLTFT